VRKISKPDRKEKEKERDLERPEEPIVVDLDANLEQDLRESRVSFRSIFKDDK